VLSSCGYETSEERKWQGVESRSEKTDRLYEQATALGRLAGDQPDMARLQATAGQAGGGGGRLERGKGDRTDTQRFRERPWVSLLSFCNRRMHLFVVPQLEHPLMQSRGGGVHATHKHTMFTHALDFPPRAQCLPDAVHRAELFSPLSVHRFDDFPLNLQIVLIHWTGGLLSEEGEKTFTSLKGWVIEPIALLRQFAAGEPKGKERVVREKEAAQSPCLKQL